MKIVLHPHAVERMHERGTTKSEIIRTVQEGESFPAKYGRIGFRRNFPLNGGGSRKKFSTKQLEVYCAKEQE